MKLWEKKSKSQQGKKSRKQLEKKNVLCYTEQLKKELSFSNQTWHLTVWMRKR